MPRVKLIDASLKVSLCYNYSPVLHTRTCCSLHCISIQFASTLLQGLHSACDYDVDSWGIKQVGFACCILPHAAAE